MKSGLAGITNNVAIFATPSPALAVVQTALDAFIVAIEEANNGGPAQTAIKNSQRLALVSLMRQLASDATLTANGDLVSLLLSGLPIQKPTRSPVGPLSPPAAPVLSQGTLSGQLRGSTPPAGGGSSYTWKVCLASAPNVVVQTLQTAAARVTI